MNLPTCFHPSNVRTVLHRGKLYARYVDDADPLLHLLDTSPSRQLDTFAAQWRDMLPDDKTTLARRALEPRFLATDVARNACALSMRRLTALVDANLESLRGLIRVDAFVDHETGELHQALTLRGAAGVNALLVMAVKQSQPLRGLYRGCVFVKRIASVLRAVEEPATINALVNDSSTIITADSAPLPQRAVELEIPTPPEASALAEAPATPAPAPAASGSDSDQRSGKRIIPPEMRVESSADRPAFTRPHVERLPNGTIVTHN